MKWVDNPLHDSILEDDTEETFLLPSWLSERNDIIFDTSCIEIGEVLGMGNFGTAMKGVIKLGNAVYLFFVFTLLNSFASNRILYLCAI